jgi:transcriptional regulator with XRE-family HTH domain
MAFGKRLHELRKQNNLTLEAVGKKLGVSKGYLSGIENGMVRPPKDRIIRKMARFFGTGEMDLLKIAWLDRMPPDVREVFSKALGLQYGAASHDDGECK